MESNTTSEFERAARDQGHSSLVGEVWQFLSHTKKWWLLPILAVLAVFAVLLLLAGTGAAPFIYTLF